MTKSELESLLERAEARDTSALIDFVDWPEFLAMIRERSLVPRSVEGFTLDHGRQTWEDDVLLHLSAKKLSSGIDPFEFTASYLKTVEMRDRDLKLLIIPVTE
ncbi:hypothetical protein [Maricaulis maris]|uniref:hypothetical protein n=1 Tax=Maricaulis maris TaxID=74318 RepID=UPI0026EC347C|nr:hypothetical protein [Maricaulis maris]